MNGNYKQCAGFTLLEMLIVMVLIGVVAGTAALSISGGAEQRLQEEAERLQQALQLAADEAVFEGTETGVALSADGYDFLRYDANDRQWHRFGGSGLRPYHLPDDIELSLNVEHKTMELKTKNDPLNAPSLIFLSTGEMMPFALSLNSIHGKITKIVFTDGVSPIALHDSETL